MHYAQRELFLIILKQQFTDIFTTSKAGKDTAELRFRVQGFVHAGELLELCSRAEIKQRMEDLHKDVLGFTVVDRKPKEYDRRQQTLKLGDCDYFDEPAFNWQR